MQALLVRGARALPLFVLLFAALADSTQALQASVASVAETCRPTLVHVAVHFERPSASPGDSEPSVRVERPGSGVVISTEGLVLTNAHLVSEIEDGAPSSRSRAEFWLEVTTQDGEQFPAHVVARDERTDLALVQIELPDGEDLPAAPLGSPQPPLPGARTLTLAFPDGEHTYSFQGAAAHPAGEVTLRKARLGADEVLIMDTRSHRMLDGGPVFSADGKLAGIYNSSHLQVPRKLDEEDEDAEPAVEYVVIVSTAAIRASFAEQVAALVPTLEEPVGTEPQLAIEAIAKIAPAVVSVWAGSDEEHPTVPSGSDPHGQRLHKNLGSGVILDPAGLVVTSADVFRGQTVDTVSVRLASGQLYSASVLEVKRTKQLALLKLELPEGVVLPVAEIGDWKAAKSGEFVAVVGRPFGPVTTLSVGVLGNLDRGQGYFQVASWLHRGHWGGAVADRNGRLIGVVVEKALGEDKVQEQGYLGFAAPIDSVLDWFDSEWGEHATKDATLVLQRDSSELLELRKSPVTAVVDATQSSLVNIMVSKAVQPEEEPVDVFDPFAEPVEASYELLGQGSGVIIDESGLALSNWHVVDAAVDGRGKELDGYRIDVTLPDGRGYVAHVLSTSRDDDLSLLRLELGEGDELDPIEMGDSDELVLGQPVVAIGNALGLSDSVSAGTLSCTSIDVMIIGRLREYAGMLMTDAAINPGNSGGALLDLQGRLVGINSAGRVGAGMAIPVNRAREVFSGKLLSAQNLRSVYLGLKPVDEEGRVVATAVDLEGPAQRAGVEEGDVLLSLGGRSVDSALEWAQLRQDLTAGAPLPLVVEREGAEQELEITALAYPAWRIQRQSGIEVSEISYEADPETVRDASIALHRAYSGIPTAEPSSLMGGVLRVVRAHSTDPRKDLGVRSGDLLLGITRLVYDSTTPSRELIKLDSIERLTSTFDPLATKDGTETECWVLRDGEVLTVPVLVRYPG